MWQWALMIVEPHTIAHVDIAAAERAFPEVLGLGQWRAADLPADHCAAWSRFVDAGDFHPIFRSKKIRPRIAPRPDLYGARFTSDRAAISIYIAMTFLAGKLPKMPSG
jgi:hypothetical protein